MKKHGFTLIELLAVIVILAIISLIAVPIVINIISDAKDESGIRSVDLYMDAVEKAILKQNLKTKYDPDECIIQKNSKLKCYKDFEEYSEELEIDMKGEKATNGTIEIENGKIVKIKYLTLGNNHYRYDDGKAYKTQAPPKEAGLYDDNYNLLASWQELVEVYGLRLNNNYNYYTYKDGISGSMYNILNNNDKLKNGTVLIVDDSVGWIGLYAFSDCKNLKSIKLPDNVGGISDFTFQNCTNLESINIPQNAYRIGQSAFAGCKSLKRIMLPNSVTNIVLYAFSNCENLEKIIIPNTVTNIGRNAFFHCKKLKSITIPGSVITIKESLFQGCENLENIQIMNGVKNIENQAFAFTNLKRITIPSSVENINSSVFWDCNNLKEVVFENTQGWYLTDFNNSEYTDIDVTNPTTNATNLVTTYKNKYWKRSE